MNKENASRFGATDLLMLLAILFWALNFIIIKIALREFSPHGFNGPRLVFASLLLLIFLRRKEGRLSVRWTDLPRLIALGIIGNTFYQLLFINGISRTTASSTSLVMTMTPIFIALLSAVFIHERIHWAGWLGIFMAFFGLYLVLFGSAGSFSFAGQSLQGDLMILAGNLCWAVYTVFSKPFLDTMSPLKLTSLTLAIGALFYLPAAAKDILATPWASLSWRSWAALFFSGMFALAVSYVIWYSSVRRIGNTKTGIFGNITPVFTVFFAYLLLDERIAFPQVLGALIIFFGFYLTRFSDGLFKRKRGGALKGS